MVGKAAKGVEPEAVVGRAVSRKNGKCVPIASAQCPWAVGACPTTAVLGVASRCALQDHPPAKRVDLSSKGIPLLSRASLTPSTPALLGGSLPRVFPETGKGLGPREGNFGGSPSPPRTALLLPSSRALAGSQATGGGGLCEVQLGPLSVILALAESTAELSGLWGCSFLASTSAFAGSVRSEPAAAEALPSGALRLPRQAAGLAVQQPRGNLRDHLKFPPDVVAASPAAAATAQRCPSGREKKK